MGWLPNLVALAILAHAFLCTDAVATGDSDRCRFVGKPIAMKINVQLIFAGYLPLFMRSGSWREDVFKRALNNPSTASERREKATAVRIGNCSKLLYHYNFSVLRARRDVSIALDDALGKALKRSETQYISAEEMADQYLALVGSAPTNFNNYTLLIYDPITASSVPEYGYVATVDGAVGTIGVSNKQRFAFLDTNARPFAFDGSKGPVPGEILLTVSRDMHAYANELFNFVFDLFTPSQPDLIPSVIGRDRVSFQVKTIDAAAMLETQMGLHDDEAHANVSRPSFDDSRFLRLVNSALRDTVFMTSISARPVSRIPVANDYFVMSMARSLTVHQFEIILDGARLARDVVRYFQRSRTSVPNGELPVLVVLFSFADSTRTPKFTDGKQIYSTSGERPVLLAVDNRLRIVDNFASDTALACARRTLDVVFGASAKALAQAGATKDTFSRVVTDCVARNLVVHELHRSAYVAAEKAVASLNLDGYDEHALPYLTEASLTRLRERVERILSLVFEGWKQSTMATAGRAVRTHAADLLQATQEYARRLNEQACKESIASDLLREVQGARGLFSARGVWKCLVAVGYLLVGVFGFLMGYRFYDKLQQRLLGRNARLELPSQTTAGLRTEVTTNSWYSTLQSPSKSKLC